MSRKLRSFCRGVWIHWERACVWDLLLIVMDVGLCIRGAASTDEERRLSTPPPSAPKQEAKGTHPVAMPPISGSAPLPSAHQPPTCFYRKHLVLLAQWWGLRTLADYVNRSSIRQILWFVIFFYFKPPLQLLLSLVYLRYHSCADIHRLYR